jgi:ATP/ADP translocase
LAIRRNDVLNGTYAAILMLLLFSPVVHPWYVSWLAVLLPLVSRWSGILFVATVSLSTLTVLNYQLTGDWSQHPWVLVLEYAPVLVAGLYELFISPEPA